MGIMGAAFAISLLFYSIVHALIWRKTRNKHDVLGEFWYNFYKG